MKLVWDNGKTIKKPTKKKVDIVPPKVNSNKVRWTYDSLATVLKLSELGIKIVGIQGGKDGIVMHIEGSKVDSEYAVLQYTRPYYLTDDGFEKMKTRDDLKLEIFKQEDSK